MIDATGMSDAALDAAYANAYDTKQYSVADQYAAEIVSRLSGAWSFVSGLFGNERFPKYVQRINALGSTFSQVGTAREVTMAQAKDVANTSFKLGGAALFVAAVVIVGIVALRK